jgi:hypothetical protein
MPHDPNFLVSLDVMNDKTKTNVAQLILKHSTICCYSDWRVDAKTGRQGFLGNQLLTAEAIHLLKRLESDLTNAHADWNEDRFRRAMRARKHAVARLERRWHRLSPRRLFLWVVWTDNVPQISHDLLSNLDPETRLPLRYFRV